MKSWILMKFNVVVNHYLVPLSLKFHEDQCTNARARVVNAHIHILSQVEQLTKGAYGRKCSKGMEIRLGGGSSEVLTMSKVW